MGGFFGTISKRECATDLFYGTDYNSHLGTRRGGLATYDSKKGFMRGIHSLENAYFRSCFEGLPDATLLPEVVRTYAQQEKWPSGTYAAVALHRNGRLAVLCTPVIAMGWGRDARGPRKLYLKLTAETRQRALDILAETPGGICVMLYMADEKKTYQAPRQYWVDEGYDFGALANLIGPDAIVLK